MKTVIAPKPVRPTVPPAQQGNPAPKTPTPPVLRRIKQRALTPEQEAARTRKEQGKLKPKPPKMQRP